jgi:hypothetical protein
MQTLILAASTKLLEKDMSCEGEAKSKYNAARNMLAALHVQAETALQLLGSAATVRLFVKKLLFAKDRKETISQLQRFLDTRIAPQELVAQWKVR